MAHDWMKKASKHAAEARGQMTPKASSALDRYGRANVKAEAATNRANVTGGAREHKIAGEAHRAAGIAAGRADLPAYAKSHQNSATAHFQQANAPTHVKEHPFGKAYQPPPGSGALSQGGHEYKGHFATFEAGHAKKYEEANRKAGAASTHATHTGAAADHKAAAQAHRNAAHMANKADNVSAQLAHTQVARTHDTIAKEGAFGTDPTTGNTQSKAQVSGTGVRGSAHRAEVATMQAREATAEASSSGDAKEHRKAANANKLAAAANRTAGNQHTASLHDQHAAAHEASVKAYQASGSKAAYDGNVAANKKAAALHQVALNKHAALGNHDAVSGHEHAGQEHSDMAAGAHADNLTEKARIASNTAGYTHLPIDHKRAAQAHTAAAEASRAAGDHETAQHHENRATEHQHNANYHANRLVEERQRARGVAPKRLLGATLHGKPSAGAINLHPTNLGAKVTPQVPAMKGTSPMGMRGTQPGHTVSGDASAKAATASSKARIKPSLVSHSLAAKAHLQAAATHTTLAEAAHRANLSANAEEHRNAARVHTQAAQDHKMEAHIHSHAIQKLKKLGPGQHHGAGGKFVGTPGGAK